MPRRAGLQDPQFFRDLEGAVADGFYGEVGAGGLALVAGVAFHGRDGFVNIVGITAEGSIAYAAQRRAGHVANAAELELLAGALERAARGEKEATGGDPRMKKGIETTAKILGQHAAAEIEAGRPRPLTAREQKTLAGVRYED
jgi:hypothetical protein